MNDDGELAAARYDQEERGMQNAMNYYWWKVTRGEVPGSVTHYLMCVLVPLSGTWVLSHGKPHTRGLRAAASIALFFLGLQCMNDRLNSDLASLHNKDRFFRQQIDISLDMQHIHGKVGVQHQRFE